MRTFFFQTWLRRIQQLEANFHFQARLFCTRVDDPSGCPVFLFSAAEPMPEPEADQDVKPERQQNGRSRARAWMASRCLTGRQCRALNQFRMTAIRYNLPKFRIATIMS